VFMCALAEQLGPELGGTVPVENRVGASGSIGARACGRSQTSAAPAARLVLGDSMHRLHMLG
jgi:tripartite-type tricarboxylate transporter receptor subunit TctC